MTPFSSNSVLVTLSVVTLCLSACDAQVGGSYNGEPLASLLGSVESELSDPPSSAQAALVWMVDTGIVDGTFGEYVDVQGTFPADFRFDLFLPPPSQALIDLSLADPAEDNRLGIAAIIAARPGVDLTDQNIVWEDVALGAVERQFVVYIEKDVEPGSRTERYLNGALPAGYHLMDAVSLTPVEIEAISDCQVAAQTNAEFEACGTTFDQLYESSEGFDLRVPLRLVDDLADLDMAELG